MARDMALPLLISARSFWQTACPNLWGVRREPNRMWAFLSWSAGKSIEKPKKGCGVPLTLVFAVTPRRGRRFPFFGVSIT
jgi:hypothetical protein